MKNYFKGKNINIFLTYEILQNNLIYVYRKVLKKTTPF